MIDFVIVVKDTDRKRGAIIILSILLTVGTAGYMVIEGWSMFDSLYMVVITMTTIGYGEVRELSTTGRVFTVFLILVGVASGSYAISAAIETLTSYEFHQARRDRRRRRQLKKIFNHAIICGYGRLGRSLARELRDRDFPLIVIDVDPASISDCEELGIAAVQGNAADETVLREAGIERAKSLIAVANSDSENVFIVLTAAGLNNHLEIIARYNSEASMSKLQRAGAHTVLSPHVIAGRRITHMLVNPRVTRFLDGVLEIGKQRLRLEDFVIGPHSPLIGKTLKEARLNVTVLAISRPNEPFISHPNADTELLPGVEMVVMGLDEDLKRLAAQINGND